MSNESNDLTKELEARYGIGAAAPTDENAPSTSLNPFLDLEAKREQQTQQEAQQNVIQRNPAEATAGAALGALAKYKNIGQNMLRPSPALFSAQATRPGQMPTPPAAGMGDIEHMMQSGQDARPHITGRQKESAHNWETNRQALTNEAYSKAFPLTSTLNNPIVQAGPQVPTQAGVAIPKQVATQMEAELQARQAAEAMARQRVLEQQQAQAAAKAKLVGAAKGTGRMAQGVVGGALAAPQLMEYGSDLIANKPNKPADQTQGLSGAGGLMMTFGGPKLGAVGALAQIPYAVKHRNEIARSMTHSDINPTAFMGMPEETQPAIRPLPASQ